jgi:uncharacterized membrane protein YfcA
MKLTGITRSVFFLFGILYMLIGIGAMLIPLGWLPSGLGEGSVPPEMHSPSGDHFLQEYGTLALALGFVFAWYGWRNERNNVFHWAVTFYFALNALIHLGGPTFADALERGLVNIVPFVALLILGVLQQRDPRHADERDHTCAPVRRLWRGRSAGVAAGTRRQSQRPRILAQGRP